MGCGCSGTVKLDQCVFTSLSVRPGPASADFHLFQQDVIYGAFSLSLVTGRSSIFPGRMEMLLSVPMKPPSFCFVNFVIVVKSSRRMFRL